MTSKELQARTNADSEVQPIDTTSSHNNAKPNVICCGILELMDIKWMTLSDGKKCMPNIEGRYDTNQYRVQFCPSCGQYIRNVIVEP